MTATRTAVVVERVKILLKGESRYLFSVLSAPQDPAGEIAPPLQPVIRCPG